MTGYVEQGERLVAAAKPRFKDFRVDFEKISNAACKAAREGRDGLDPATAGRWFSDVDWDLRLPLQRRYADAGAFDALAKFHATQNKNYLGRNTPWPDAHGQAALDLFAEHGRAELGVALVLAYLDMQWKRLKRDFSSRSPRGSRTPRDDGVERAIAGIGRIIANAIPDRKADLLRDMDTVAPYLAAHGSDEDRARVENLRREIWMERRA